jgi:transcriptional regulator with XRE-family HTH domain
MTNLRSFRLDRGLTLAELGDELHVAFKTVQRWETGAAHPRPGAGKRLSDYFGVPLSVLLTPQTHARSGTS